MTKLIDVYRLVSGVETVVYRISKEKATLYQTIMDKDKVTVEVVTEEPISLQEGDYVLVDGIKYRINRDPEEKQSSEKKHSYTSSFEAPIYTLIDKLFCSGITGYTTFTLTGKLRDFLELLIWNVNYDATDNPKGVDTGWTIGLCPDTDYMNITFAGVTCRDALNTFASKFGVEYYAENKTLNFVSHIEKETGLIFTQGKGEGLYEVDKKNIDDGDLVTRVYAKGGTENVIPGEGDYDGRLILPEGYIENFSDSNRVVEAVVEFDDIHPTFEGAVGVVSGDNNREFICAAIDFDLADVAVSDEARVNFLTGDLMGKSFEFKWNNSLKKITLIYQEDELAAIDATTGVRPNIPSTSKYLRGGELFNFTGIKLSGTYKTNAITKLRTKATEWLSYYCRKRVKFELNVDYRYLREKKITLHCGDLITINVPLHNISKLIRITSIERNLYTGKLTCVVSNYLDEKWKDKIETEVANIKSSTTTVNGGYGASSVSILETIDEREASDSNVLSSLRALREIAERALSKTSADTAAGLITFIEGLVSKKVITAEDGLLLGKYVTGISGGKIDSNGDAEVRNLVARIKATVAELEVAGNAKAKTVTVSDKVTTLNLLVQKLAEIYDLNVSNVATLFRTIVKDYVSSESFVPGITGEGMKLYKALNGDWNLEVDNVTIRKAMTVFELIISKVRAVNGGLVVSQGNGRVKSVNETTGTPAYYVLGIEGDMTFVADDLVRCQVFSTTGAKYYWVRVDSISDNSIVIPKSEFPENVVPSIGDDLVQMGNKTNATRQGILYLTASEDGKPRFSVLDGVSSTDLTDKSKVILGCLDGITDSDFPSDAQPNGYGLWAGNVFLKGLFILRNGKSIEDELSDQITAVQTAFEIREGQISTKVTQATTAAQTATAKAGEAATSAGTASSKASEAAGSATTAGQKATDATNAANNAATILQTVTQKETKINQTADAIQLKATRAETAAGKAESVEASINLKADGIVLQASNKAAQTAVDGVQVGGRNLLKGTKDFSGSSSIGGLTSDTYNGFSIIHGSYSGSGYADICAWNGAITPESNTEYTLSFWCKGAGDYISYFYPSCVVSGYNSAGNSTTAGDGSIAATLTSDWKRVWIVWRTGTITEAKNVLVCRIFNGTEAYLCGVKFEKGNKATDWTPAPEDVTADAQSMANTAENNAKTYVNTNFTTKVEYTAKLQVLNDAINGKVSQTTYDGLASRVESAEAKITSDAINLTVQSQVITYSNLAAKLAGAKMLYVDPAFKNGTNSINVYNNYGNGTVAIDRVERHNDNPTDSNYQIRIVSSGFSQTPGRGGFCFANYAQPYAEYICKFVAWIPTNCSVEFASNSMGSGGYQQWLTPKQGQGKWAEYVSYVRAGDGGNSSTNFYYLNNGSDETVTWWLCYATVFDCSKNEYTPDVYALKAGLEIVSGGIRFFGQDFSFAGKVTIGSLDSTIIENNKIKTSLINADAIITTELLARKIQATDISTSKLTVNDGARIGDLYIYGGGLCTSPQGLNPADLPFLYLNKNSLILSSTILRYNYSYIDRTELSAGKIAIKCVTTGNFSITNPGLQIEVSGNSDNTAINILAGYISGFRLRTLTVRTSQTLSVSDGIIISEADSEITLTLPSNPGNGKMYFIRKNGGGRIWVNGSYIINDGDWYRERSTSVQLNRGCLAIFMYNGTYWTYNTING